MTGSVVDVALAATTAAIGVILVAIGCTGQLFRPLAGWQRGWAAAAGSRR